MLGLCKNFRLAAQLWESVSGCGKLRQTCVTQGSGSSFDKMTDSWVLLTAEGGLCCETGPAEGKESLTCAFHSRRKGRPRGPGSWLAAAHFPALPPQPGSRASLAVAHLAAAARLLQMSCRAASKARCSGFALPWKLPRACRAAHSTQLWKNTFWGQLSMLYAIWVEYEGNVLQRCNHLHIC